MYFIFIFLIKYSSINILHKFIKCIGQKYKDRNIILNNNIFIPFLILYSTTIFTKYFYLTKMAFQKLILLSLKIAQYFFYQNHFLI